MLLVVLLFHCGFYLLSFCSDWNKIFCKFFLEKHLSFSFRSHLILIFVSENKVTTLKGDWFFSYTTCTDRTGSSFEQVNGMGKERGSRATKKCTKSCVSDAGPECVCDVWCPCMSQAGGEGIPHKMSCCLTPVVAPLVVQTLLIKAECAVRYLIVTWKGRKKQERGKRVLQVEWRFKGT